jgi:DNA-binding IclR family transcriptional regulator
MVPVRGQEGDGHQGLLVKSAKRCLEILNLLTTYPDGLRFVEIEEKLSVPRSSLHGLIATLTYGSWVSSDPVTKKFMLGVRALEAGRAFLKREGFPSRARPYMEQIRDDLGETVQLSVLEGRYNVYVAKVDGRHALALASAVGVRLPAHATGVGKALLSGLDSASLNYLYNGVKLESCTAQTITSKSDLVSELARIRELGYATDNQEYSIGVRCIAVPIHNTSGQIAAAISTSIPTVRYNEALAGRALALLVSAAAELSRVIA